MIQQLVDVLNGNNQRVDIWVWWPYYRLQLLSQLLLVQSQTSELKCIPIKLYMHTKL